MATEKRNMRKERAGVVTSDAMNKTVVVQAEQRYAHPVYGKVLRRTKKYYAHDEKNEAKCGDRVEVFEARPLSKQKRWRLLRIVERAADLAGIEVKEVEVPGAKPKPAPEAKTEEKKS